MSDYQRGLIDGAMGFLRFDEPQASADQDDPQTHDEEDTQPFAREQELRREQDETPLSGCDVEHCQRMHE